MHFNFKLYCVDVYFIERYAQVPLVLPVVRGRRLQQTYHRKGQLHQGSRAQVQVSSNEFIQITHCGTFSFSRYILKPPHKESSSSNLLWSLIIIRCSCYLSEK